MKLKDLIELGDVSEMQAFAFLSYLNGKVPEEEMQKNVDAYCDNLASSFVEKHQAGLQWGLSPNPLAWLQILPSSVFVISNLKFFISLANIFSIPKKQGDINV